MLGLHCQTLVALRCSELLVANLTSCGGHRVTLPEVKPPAGVFVRLRRELNNSYLVEAFRVSNGKREDFKVLVREGWR